MARPTKRKVGKKTLKVAKKPSKPVAVKRVVILESDEEMDKLYHDFEMDDTSEIEDIVSGRIGEVDADQWGD